MHAWQPNCFEMMTRKVCALAEITIAQVSPVLTLSPRVNAGEAANVHTPQADGTVLQTMQKPCPRLIHRSGWSLTQA